MIVPNQAIATYVTQWTYDSHNRLLEMIYPDEEKITYSYNLGGQLEKMHGYKSYGYYGARYYEPKTSLWVSTDPLQEKYFNNRL